MTKYSSTAAKIKLFTVKWEGSDREETQHTELVAALSHVPHFSHGPKHSLPSSLLISLKTLSQILKLQEVTDYTL
jgi:hypothetical protein